MGTPERQPGPEFVEKLVFEDEGQTLDGPGQFLYDFQTGAFKARDSVGEYDPRVGGSVGNIGVKSGTEAAGTFTGNPKKKTVSFATAFPSITYAVLLQVVTTGGRQYHATVESKAVGSFIINLGANNISSLVEVGWHAIRQGEQ